ncbi:MAG TPA: hypothetical protein VHV32_01640 [Candidatus Angelobacter sp.]|nr:hypothetical protein [Candidatus Angelobacter sp.]
MAPEKEALLRQAAARTGQDAVEVIQEAVDRLLDHGTWFVQEVEKGLSQALKETSLNTMRSSRGWKSEKQHRS